MSKRFTNHYVPVSFANSTSLRGKQSFCYVLVNANVPLTTIGLHRQECEAWMSYTSQLRRDRSVIALSETHFIIGNVPQGVYMGYD